MSNLTTNTTLNTATKCDYGVDAKVVVLPMLGIIAIIVMICSMVCQHTKVRLLVKIRSQPPEKREGYIQKLERDLGVDKLPPADELPIFWGGKRRWPPA